MKTLDFTCVGCDKQLLAIVGPCKRSVVWRADFVGNVEEQSAI